MIPPHTFYGSGTVGERGQVVIPSEARAALRLKKGEKLLVFGMGTDTLVFSKVASVEKIAAQLATRLATMQRVLKQQKTAR